MRTSLNRPYYANKKAPSGLDIRVVEGATPVISTSDLKAYLREVGYLEEPATGILKDMIRSAMNRAKQYMNACAGVETLEARWQRVYTFARLPYGPVKEIIEVKQQAGDGTTRVLVEGSDYVVTGEQVKEIELTTRSISLGNSTRGDESLIVTYKAGYDNDSPYMPDIRMAVRMAAADMYMMRTSTVDGSMGRSAQNPFDILASARLR